MVISCKLLHSQTSYLVSRHNTINDIKWHKISLPWSKVKVTCQGQRSQTWRSLRSLNASCWKCAKQNNTNAKTYKDSLNSFPWCTLVKIKTCVVNTGVECHFNQGPKYTLAKCIWKYENDIIQTLSVIAFSAVELTIDIMDCN